MPRRDTVATRKTHTRTIQLDSYGRPVNPIPVTHDPFRLPSKGSAPATPAPVAPAPVTPAPTQPTTNTPSLPPTGTRMDVDETATVNTNARRKGEAPVNPTPTDNLTTWGGINEDGIGGGDPRTMHAHATNRNFGNAMNKYNVGYQETAVLFHPPTRNLFQDTLTITHQTIFNFTWSKPFSQYFNEYQGTWGLRLNSPIEPMIAGYVSTQTAGNAWQAGVHYGTSSTGTQLTPNPLLPYVVSTEYTTRRKFSKNLVIAHKLYKQYTTLECRYKITMKNPSQLSTSEMDVYNIKEAYSTNGTSRCPAFTQPCIPFDAWTWPEVQRKRLGYTQANGTTNPPATGPISLVFEGAWRPNQIPHEPAADADYKTWQSTTADVRNSPSLPANGVVEAISFFGMPCIEKPYLGTGEIYGYNVTVEVEWDCQYKDLRNGYRFMNQDATDIDYNMTSVS